MYQFTNFYISTSFSCCMGFVILGRTQPFMRHELSALNVQSTQNLCNLPFLLYKLEVVQHLIVFKLNLQFTDECNETIFYLIMVFGRFIRFKITVIYHLIGNVCSR